MGHLETIKIEGTALSPFISMDSESGIIQFSGRSVLSDSELFYRPIVGWINEYLQKPRPKTVFICKFQYYNNSFSKIMFTIFKKFEKGIFSPNRFEIQWYYNEDDEDMLILGKEFRSLLKEIDFKLINERA